MSNITMTQALARVSLLDKKIGKLISNLQVAGTAKFEEDFPSTSRDAFLAKGTADLQSIKDLMNQRTKLKAEIAKSNAATHVTIGGTLMTVTEALMYRETTVAFIPQLNNRIQDNLASCISTIKMADKKAQMEVNNTLAAMSKEATEDVIKAVTDQVNINNKLELVSVTDILEKSKTAEEEYLDLLTEIDHTLSVSNAVTTLKL